VLEEAPIGTIIYEENYFKYGGSAMRAKRGTNRHYRLSGQVILNMAAVPLRARRGTNRVSSETSFVSYFAKHETKQVSCFAKQTSCFAKFCFEAKQAVSHVSLFLKQNETVRFACFVQVFF
jgi:hypothetical protein